MPFFVLAIPAAITGAAELLAASWTGIILAGEAIDAYEKYWESEYFKEEITNRLNIILYKKGLDIQFRNVFNDAMVIEDLDKFAVNRINSKLKTEFKSFIGINEDTFLEQAGTTIADRLNARTGSKITTVWPLENLKSGLKSEVLRQFDNRGRYTGGALFKVDTLARIRGKIIAKNPAMMAELKGRISSGTEAERIKREKAAARQRLYENTHQQVWIRKG